MIHSTIDRNKPKGWFVGPLNSHVPVPVGYANQGINELHYHSQMYEIYLVAKGTSTALVNGETVTLQPGDILIVEPHEIHTFTQSSPDYLHFVVQAPFVAQDKHVVE
jgi:quercetin dioxygenase-like cupin family protein